MHEEIRFHIAGKIGKICFNDIKNRKFVEQLKAIETLGSENFTLEIKNTNEEKGIFKLTSFTKAIIFVPQPDILRVHAFMTIFKASLQTLLIRDHIILFHGISDDVGNIYVGGTDTEWYNKLKKPVSIIDRLVIVKKIRTKYYIYSDLLKTNNTQNIIPVKSVEIIKTGFQTRRKAPLEYLLQSTWLYFFFHHFIKHKLSLPVLVEKQLDVDLFDLIGLVSYTDEIPTNKACFI